MLKDFFRRRFTAAAAVLPAHPEPVQIAPPPATGAFTAECLAACFVPALLADYHALLATRDPRNAVVVTTRYAPLDEALQHALAQALGYAATPFEEATARPHPAPGYVWRLEELAELGKEAGVAEVNMRLVATLTRGCRVLLLAGEDDGVPEAAQALMCREIAQARFNATHLASLFDAAVRADFPHEPHDWLRAIEAEDLLACASADAAALRCLHYLATERLAPYACADAPALATLEPLDKARDWAEAWAAEVREIAGGSARLGWTDLERSALLVGPRGAGKTELVRALARAAGLPLIEATVPPRAAGEDADRSWLEQRWRKARALAPAVLLLDSPDGELDTAAAFCDRFDARQPVFVFTTQLKGRAFPGFVAPGRFERVFHFTAPEPEALVQVFQPLLDAAGCVADAAQLAELARDALSGLSSLSDVQQVVRRAAQRARREGRALAVLDVMREVHGSEAVSVTTTGQASRRQVAYHEAGHAVMMLLSPRSAAELTAVSLDPNAVALGTTRMCFDEGSPGETRQELLERLRGLLGGRAAEQVLLGPDGVSTGACQDLEQATSLALFMSTRLGFGAQGSLVSWKADLSRNDALRGEIDQLLRAQYEICLDELQQHWGLVETIVEALLERTQLTGNELRAMYARAKPGAAERELAVTWFRKSA